MRPLFDQFATLLEALDKGQLVEEARKVSPAAESLVSARAGWNPLARTAVVEGGADTAVKYLNAAGISAEYAPELKLGIGLASILTSRQMLLAELRAMQPAIEVKAKVEPVKESAVLSNQ